MLELAILRYKSFTLLELFYLLASMFSFWPICTSSFFDKCYVWTNADRIKLGPNFDSLTNPLVNCKKEEVIFPFFYCHRGRFCTRRWRREEHFYDSLRTNFTFKKVKQNYTRVLCAVLLDIFGFLINVKPWINKFWYAG